MPKLLMFAPCEKALLGADNSLSLINVMLSVKVLPKDSAENPDVARIPGGEWTVVAVWQKEPGDDGERFEQRLTLADTQGKVRMTGLIEFDFPKTYHRTFGKLRGLPSASVAGEIMLAIAVRNMKTQDWIEKALYPISVIPADASERTTH